MKQKRIVGYLLTGIAVFLSLMGVFACCFNGPVSASAQTQDLGNVEEEVQNIDIFQGTEIYEYEEFNSYEFESSEGIFEEDDIYVMPQAPWEVENKQNKPYSQTLAINGAQTMADDANTWVSGKLQWVDDKDVKHPLRRVQVDICDYDSALVSQRLGTVFTDNEGNYSFGFKNKDKALDFENGGYDLFLKIHAGDSNANVTDDKGKEYIRNTSDGDVRMNVVTGTTTDISKTIYPITFEGKAFQISQALLTARDFAWNMMGSMPSDVTVRYPYDEPNDKGEFGGCYYDPVYKRITITRSPAKKDDSSSIKYPEAYASWDMIMHEYGHHIASEMGIDDSPAGSHWFNGIMTDHLATCKNVDCKCAARDYDKKNLTDIQRFNAAKEDAMKLVWSESWASAFGIIAQDYYSNYLTNIENVDGPIYSAYNGAFMNLNLMCFVEAKVAKERYWLFYGICLIAAQKRMIYLH